ncbi:MAG: hypothetical protein OEL69_02190 [Nitrosopumilus sp.]|nr:hypothetical protein [Nitrosopumilus sp.]
MKIKCSHCSKTTYVTLDKLIFENADEETFVTYLAAELSSSQRRSYSPEEEERK